MNYGGRIVSDMRALVRYFARHCTERTTLDELAVMLDDDDLWPDAHDLHTRIRDKTIVAERSGNARDTAQYLFEEICAKTLYNLSHESAPFDPDSPYWIVPNAIALARALDVDESNVVTIVTGQPPE